MTNRMRIALLGCGDVAQRDYLPEMHRLADRIELVAVCGRSEARARKTAEQYSVPNWFTDYREMLDQVDAEVVINLTPIQLHAETTLAALQSGRHVYSEKPAATTVSEGEQLREIAHQNQLILVCAPSVLLFPQVRKVHQLLESQVIGPVHSAVGHGFGGVPPWAGYGSDPSQFFAIGAGPIADMGVYPLHAIIGLFGPVRQVSAMAGQAQREFVVQDGPARGKRVPIEVPDTWQVLLELNNDLLVTVLANNSAVGSKAPQLELYGLNGTIAVDLLDVSAPVELLHGGQWQQVAVQHERQKGPDHLLGVEHLVDCIEQGRNPLPNIDHAIHVLEVIEAAGRSAKNGRRIQLKTAI